MVKISVVVKKRPSQGRTDLSNRIIDVMERRLRQAGSDVRDTVRSNISGPSPPPSTAGQFPGKVSGALSSSLYSAMKGRLSVEIGSTLWYARVLHEGHPGGVQILPVRAKMLRWIDWRTGNPEFRHSVIQGALAPRPFLTMTLDNMWSQGLGRWLCRPI